MARALSENLRLRVLKASDEGLSPTKAAALVGVSVSSATRWIARAEVGELMPRPQGRRCVSRLDANEDFIVGLIADCKDITLDMMVERLATARTLSISRSALGAWLRGRGWTFKKGAAKYWSRHDRELFDGIKVALKEASIRTGEK